MPGRRYADQTSVGALVEFDGIVEDIITSPVALSRKNPAAATKKNPKQSTRLGFLSGCLNLGSYWAGRRGVGGWGSARSGLYARKIRARPADYAERFYRKIRRPFGIPWYRRDASL